MIKENKIGLVVTLLVLVFGSAIYIVLGRSSEMGGKESMDLDSALFKDMQLKVARSPEGQVKVFALASNNEIAKLEASEGAPIPDSGRMVIGFKEAQMMKEESLFSKPGDRLEGLFGISVAVGGVLQETGTMLDDMHFLDAHQYYSLEGEEGRMFIKVNPEGMPKLFYYQRNGERLPAGMSFSEGSFDDYNYHKMLGKRFYPIIIGSAEAEMMREEKLFSEPGDTIEGFFGNDVIVVGVLEPTNSSIDMAHIIPLREEDITGA